MPVKKENRGLEVSMPKSDKEELKRRAEARGFASAADYIRALIRDAEPDLEMRLDDSRHRRSP